MVSVLTGSHEVVNHDWIVYVFSMRLSHYNKRLSCVMSQRCLGYRVQICELLEDLRAWKEEQIIIRWNNQRTDFYWIRRSLVWRIQLYFYSFPSGRRRKELFTILFTCKGTSHLRFLAGLLELIFVNLDVSRASIVFLFTLDSDWFLPSLPRFLLRLSFGPNFTVTDRARTSLGLIW